MLVLLWWSHALDCIALLITHIVEVLVKVLGVIEEGPYWKAMRAIVCIEWHRGSNLRPHIWEASALPLSYLLGSRPSSFFFSFKAFLSFNFWEVTVQTPDGNGILSICPDGKGQRVQLSMAWASSCGKRILVKSWTCGIGKVGLLSKSNHGCSVLPDGSSITSLGGLTMLLLTPRTPLFPSKGRVFSLPLLFQEHRCSLR